MTDHVQEIKCALYNHAQGQIAKHKTNVMLMMERSVGVGEHSNIVETIEEEDVKQVKNVLPGGYTFTPPEGVFFPQVMPEEGMR